MEKTERGWASPVSVAFLIAASIVGMLLADVLVLQFNLKPFQVLLRQSLVGALYGVICLLGIVAVFYPAQCRGMFQRTQTPLSQVDKRSSSARISGHHPDCKNFAGNRIKIGERELCAACSGLLIGSIIALIATALQFFVGLDIVWGSVWLLALGEVGMVLGLAQIKFSGYVKVIANVVFVVGSFVTLVEADVLGGSMLLDVYVLGRAGRAFNDGEVQCTFVVCIVRLRR